MYALVDYDPDGLSIFRTYQVGSSSLVHEEDTTVPQLRWLGIRSDQLLPSTHSAAYGGSSQSSQESVNTSSQSSQDSIVFSDTGGHDELLVPDHRRPSRHYRNGRMGALSQLTPRDRRMAVNMLRTVCQEQEIGEVDDTDQTRELQMMLMLNVKAEIQAVDDLGDITRWLDEKLRG
jgi:meiotic recombination protein SPO11